MAVLAQSPAVPGTVNYTDGEVSVNGTARQSAVRVATGDGMAEVLLIPGSFLRVGNHSSVVVSASNPSNVQVTMARGQVMVDVIHIPPGDSIAIDERGASVTIQQPGLYGFNAKKGTVAVYDGSVRVTRGALTATLLRDTGAKLRNLREFHAAPDTSDALYAWSYSRSHQLSLESIASAQTFSGSVRAWQTPAWYWDPWAGSYTYLSASGFMNSSFGWPFYAPGHSHNYIPVYPGGDSYLYGRPVPRPSEVPGVVPPPAITVPMVPLTAPGVPRFPTGR